MDGEGATTRRGENRRAMEIFMGAVGDRDFAALEAICQPDLLVELPYSDPPQRLEGFAAYRAAVAPALEIFRFRLSVTALHEMADVDSLLAEYTSEGIAVPTGKPYRNVYIGLWRFRNGRVAGLREFYNPDRASQALATD